MLLESVEAVSELRETAFDMGLHRGRRQLEEFRYITLGPTERVDQHHHRALLGAQLTQCRHQFRGHRWVIDMNPNPINRDRTAPRPSSSRTTNPVQIPSRVVELADTRPVLPRPTQRIHRSRSTLHGPERRDQRSPQPGLDLAHEPIEIGRTPTGR